MREIGLEINEKVMTRDLQDDEISGRLKKPSFYISYAE